VFFVEHLTKKFRVRCFVIQKTSHIVVGVAGIRDFSCRLAFDVYYIISVYVGRLFCNDRGEDVSWSEIEQDGDTHTGGVERVTKQLELSQLEFKQAQPRLPHDAVTPQQYTNF